MSFAKWRVKQLFVYLFMFVGYQEISWEINVVDVSGGETEDEGARHERGGVDEQFTLGHAGGEDTGGREESRVQD